MPRRDDEDDYDPPPRRRPRDDEDDRPRARRRDDDEDDRPPPRRRARDDDDFAPAPRKKSRLGLILGIVGGVFLVLCLGAGGGAYYLYDEYVYERKVRQESAYNLRQIGLALHNYESTQGGLPTNSVAADGRPGLSWRVHILPYLGEQNLYSQFQLTEAWDSPTNLRLLNQMPRVYATPAEQRSGTRGTKTYYRGFSSPGAVFAPRGGPAFAGGGPPGLRPVPRGLRITDITDGTSNTIAVVEAGDAVEWTKPDDLDAGPGKAFPTLGGVRPKRDEIVILMVDGSYRIIRRPVNETTLRAAVTANNGEVIYLP